METHCGIAPSLDIPDCYITEFLHTASTVIKECQDYPVTQPVFRIDIRTVDQFPDLSVDRKAISRIEAFLGFDPLHKLQWSKTF